MLANKNIQEQRPRTGGRPTTGGRPINNDDTPTTTQPRIVPDPDTIRNFRGSDGNEYTIGLIGNELIQKLDSGWDRVTGWSMDMISKLKKRFYNVDRGQSVYNRNQNRGSSSCNTNGWLKDPTGSKKYVYKVKNCKWFAKNTNTCKEFNINDDSKYQTSVDKLNNEYPNSLKNCVKTHSSNEPLWVKTHLCISGFGDSLPNNNSSKVSYKSSNGKDVLNFYKDFKFIYEFENGSIINGLWKCENNEMIINTNDGYQYTSSKGWSKINQPKPEELKKDYEISKDDEIIYKQVDINKEDF